MAKTPFQNAAASSEETQVRMSFGEHLDELRKRIMRALLGGLIGVGLCVNYMFVIFDIIARPYRLAAARAGVPGVLATFKPQEGFFTYLTLAIQAGLVLTSPWIIFQLWQFIGAGLYVKERRMIYKYIGPSMLLFLTGIAFFYFIVLPMTLSFFFSFAAHSAGPPPQAGPWDLSYYLDKRTHAQTTTAPATTATAPATTLTVELAGTPIPVLNADPAKPTDGGAFVFYNRPEGRLKVRIGEQTFIVQVSEQDSMIINSWRADDYLSFVTFSALIFGIAFEMPMVILILAQMGIAEPQTFRNIRKFAYFGILVTAVIAAPSGDILTLAFLFVPLVLLYEVGIIAAAISIRNRPKEGGVVVQASSLPRKMKVGSLHHNLRPLLEQWPNRSCAGFGSPLSQTAKIEPPQARTGYRRHRTKHAYGCFLPDLTRFTVHPCTGPAHA